MLFLTKKHLSKKEAVTDATETSTTGGTITDKEGGACKAVPTHPSFSKHHNISKLTAPPAKVQHP